MAHVQKKGFTLIELMVVIAIMGILSAMGVVGLQTAVENARVDDAAKNVTAFLERTANEANRMSATLCLRASNSNSRRLLVYKAADCGNLPGGAEPLYSMELDQPMKFAHACSGLDFDCDSEGCEADWLQNNKGVFKPKLGLSAAPVAGHVCMQYAGTEHYAVAVKSKTENFIRAMTCDEDGCE